MAILKWDESFSVGVKEIDLQHKMLIEMNNEFYKNIKAKSSRESLGKLLRKAKNYTVFHFKSEEDYMKENNYPHLTKHKREHEKFIKKVQDLEERMNNDELIVSVEVTSFLNDWLKNHIQGEDLHFAQVIKKRG